MLRPLAVTIVVAVLGGSSALAGSKSGTKPCGASIVHRTANPSLAGLSKSRWIRVRSREGGIVGVLFGGESVGGRLALYAGGVNPSTGTNEKILWRFPTRAAAGSELTVTGHRLDRRGTFRDSFFSAGAPGMPGKIYPSIIAVPTPGCSRLELTTGSVAPGEVVARVR